MMKNQESPGLSAVSELVKISGGDPKTILPSYITSRTIAPKISIGYAFAFDEFNLLVSAGTSQDWSNSWKLRGSAAVAGKTYPYPESFSIRARGYQTWETGFSLGGEFCFDNQHSEHLLNNSNIKPNVKGLLNQIGTDINLLGSGVTRFMQVNALVGWQKSKDRVDLGVYALIGLVGNSWGAQADFKIRYFLRDR